MTESTTDEPLDTKRRTNKPLDETQWREICAILAVGCGRAIAARYVGCDPRTIRRAEKRDPEIQLRLERAESQSEVLCLRSIQEAAKVDRYWRAAAWLLERTLPAKYSAQPGKGIPVPIFIRTLEEILNVVNKSVSNRKERDSVLLRIRQLRRNAISRSEKKSPTKADKSPRKRGQAS